MPSLAAGGKRKHGLQAGRRPERPATAERRRDEKALRRRGETPFAPAPARPRRVASRVDRPGRARHTGSRPRTSRRILAPTDPGPARPRRGAGSERPNGYDAAPPRPGGPRLPGARSPIRPRRHATECRRSETAVSGDPGSRNTSTEWGMPVFGLERRAAVASARSRSTTTERGAPWLSPHSAEVSRAIQWCRGQGPSSPRASCSFLTARIQSICTAGRERPIRSATSLNESRSRLRSMITS